MFTIKTLGGPVTICGVRIPGIDSEPKLIDDPKEVSAIRGYFNLNRDLDGRIVIQDVKPKAKPKAKAKESPPPKVEKIKAAPPKVEKPKEVAPAKKSSFFKKKG